VKRPSHRLVRAIALLLLAALPWHAAQATNLTGAFKHPDGSPVNGKLILLLSQPARLADNTAQIVPMVKIFAVTGGALESGAFVYGNDVMVPAGTYYLARLVDANNNLLFEQKWSITGTDLDLGAMTPTTTGVVLADPLIRNLGVSQVVQGPVTFSSPITAFSITLNGTLNPGASAAYDLGNPALAWREIYTQRWNGDVVPGSATGLVTPPSIGPVVTVESTSGGTVDNSARHYKVTFITLNGETTPGPATTFTPSTCGAAACKIKVQAGAHEWRTGAFAYRVYVSSDGTNYYRQTGFPGELDSAGAMANAHYVPGDVLLSALILSGAAPPASNTAAMDADQVALNQVCSLSTLSCYGTLKYKPNPSGGYAQAGTTPLVLSTPGTRVQGHGSPSVDTTGMGSTRQCSFTATTALGCVMVIVPNGVRVDGLHVSSTGAHGYMLLSSSGSQNMVEIGNATVSVSGTNAVAPLRIRGIFYYLRFPNLQLHANSTGTGANKGAGVLISNSAGSEWLFSGPVRWTVRDNNDAIRNDKGVLDPDRGANPPGFIAAVSKFVVRDVQVQWGPTGSGQGVLLKGENLWFTLDGVTHSDYNPASGTGPLIEAGADASAAGACCSGIAIENSPFLNAAANNAAAFRLVSNVSNTLASFHLRNAQLGGIVDLNNLSFFAGMTVTGNNMPSCNPNATGARIINMVATQSLHCSYAANNGIPEARVANQRFTGGVNFHSDSSGANYRSLFWSGSNTFVLANGDPTVNANLLGAFGGASKQVSFYDAAGAGILLHLDQVNNTVGIGRAADSANKVVLPNNQTIAAMNNAGSAFRALVKLTTSDRVQLGDTASTPDFPVATGTPPFTVASATEVTNLNTERWHGKRAVDFSATLDFSSIAGQSCATLNITATGAAADNPVAASWPVALEAGLAGIMHVTAADTVTVRLCNVTAGAIDPASQTFAGRVIK